MQHHLAPIQKDRWTSLKLQLCVQCRHPQTVVVHHVKECTQYRCVEYVFIISEMLTFVLEDSVSLLI